MKPHTYKRQNGFSKMRYRNVTKLALRDGLCKNIRFHTPVQNFLCTLVKGYQARHFNQSHAIIFN